MKTVLFVCVHNSGRSQMAEAFLNRLAKGKAKALSAGTDPANAIDPTVVEAMGEVGIDISASKPKALTPKMIEPLDRVITMGCRVEEICPTTFIETEDWELEEPKDKPLEKVRKIRDKIKIKVIKMLEETGV
ncbi:MAG: low molecular weight phosphatase family protein [Dehalococcoidales bacterium]|nr:low molecular weight phosphatase family protein [Dehalococcoidales bacterium]